MVRLRERRRKAAPDLCDLVTKGCRMLETPRGADFLIDLYFAVDKRPCQFCEIKCNVFKPRQQDRRRKETTQ